VVAVVVLTAALCMAADFGNNDASFNPTKRTNLANFNNPQAVGLEGFSGAAYTLSYTADCRVATCTVNGSRYTGTFGPVTIKQTGPVLKSGKWLMQYSGGATSFPFTTCGFNHSISITALWDPSTGGINQAYTTITHLSSEDASGCY
jgi:hypothetical protein